ncbi:MAG: hypothetical protein QM831_29110 [Kofleriaceae bacterium]
MISSSEIMSASITRLYAYGVPPAKILRWATLIIGKDAAIERMALALDLSAAQLERAEIHLARGNDDPTLGIAPPPLAKPPDGRWNEEDTASVIAGYTFTGNAGEALFPRPNHLTLRWWEVTRNNDQRWLLMVERDGVALPIDEHVADTTVGNVSTYTRERTMESLITVESPYPIAEVKDAFWQLDGTEWVLKLDHKSSTSYVYNTAIWWSVDWTLRVGLRCKVEIRTHTDVSS